jgi:hypothetical protein
VHCTNATLQWAFQPYCREFAQLMLYY